MDFVLPTSPTYYNTKSLYDYVDSDLLRYFNEHNNFSFLNKFIIIAESSFKEKNAYKEIQTLKNTYGNTEGSALFRFDSTFIEENFSEYMDKSREYNFSDSFKILISKIQSLYDYSNEQMFNMFNDKFLSLIDKKENRYEFYQQVCTNYLFGLEGTSKDPIKNKIFEDYNNFIQRLKPENHDKAFDNRLFIINDYEINKFGYDLEDLEYVENDRKHVRHMLQIYNEQIKLLNCIKFFDNNECDSIYVHGKNRIAYYYSNGGKIYDIIQDSDKPDHINCHEIQREEKEIDLTLIFNAYRSIESPFYKQLLINIGIEKEQHILDKSMPVNKETCIPVKVARI